MLNTGMQFAETKRVRWNKDTKGKKKFPGAEKET